MPYFLGKQRNKGGKNLPALLHGSTAPHGGISDAGSCGRESLVTKSGYTREISKASAETFHLSVSILERIISALSVAFLGNSTAADRNSGHTWPPDRRSAHRQPRSGRGTPSRVSKRCRSGRPCFRRPSSRRWLRLRWMVLCNSSGTEGSDHSGKISRERRTWNWLRKYMMWQRRFVLLVSPVQVCQ